MILDSQPPDVSDEAATIPRRRREFLRLGSVFGFVAAGFAAALLLHPFWENSQVPEQVATSRPRNPPTISEENFIWSETRTTVDRVLEKKEYWQEPLEQAEWHHLRSAYDYFQQELTRPRETEFDEAKHLIDLSYFARIAFHIRQFAVAEQALRELVRKTETMGHSGKRIPQFDQTMAFSLNCLSCQSARLGNLIEARKSSARSQEVCRNQLAKTPDDQELLLTLAFALRNAGVIEELSDRDGSSLITQAAETGERYLKCLQETSVQRRVTIPAFLADTYYLAGYAHLQRRHLEQADSAWARAAKALETQIANVESLSKEVAVLPPQRKFLKAFQRLKNDQTLLRKSLGRDSEHVVDSQSQSGKSRDLQWSWSSLLPSGDANLLLLDDMIHGLMPGEFERQEAIMISWTPEPWNEVTLLEMIAAIVETTDVVLLVGDEELRKDANEHLRRAGIPRDRIHFSVIRTDTIWCRDFGPTIVRCSDGADRVAQTMFCESFDDPWAANDSLPYRWSLATGWPIFQLPILAETGSLLSNGHGLCVASTCVLTKNAGSGIPEAQVTASLKRWTGASHIVYLQPLQGEPTQHVDWFAAFTSPNTIVIGDYAGSDPVNARILDDNAKRLRGIMTSAGPLIVERIPMPPRGRNYFGGTYTNVVFANGVLLVPTWPEAPQETEEAVLAQYRRLLPGWRIVPIDSQSLGRKLGSLHCATMNLPRLHVPLLHSDDES